MSIKAVALLTCSLVILSICIAAILSVYQYLHVLGVLLLVCTAILAVFGTIFIMALGAQHLLRPHVTDISEHGTLVSIMGKSQFVQPYSIKEIKAPDTDKVVESSRVETIEDTPDIDSLIINSEIAKGKFVLGYDNNTPVSQEYKDKKLRTFAIGGVSRTGKSVTMFFYIIQWIINGAELYICDPHHNKEDGLLKRLGTLSPYFKSFKSNDEISIGVRNFREKLKQRMEGAEPTRDLVLVIDEWTQLNFDKQLIKEIVETLQLISISGAGYGCFMVLSGQLWQPSMCGGTSVKDSLHASIVHRLPQGQSKHIIEKPFDKLSQSLPVGVVYMYIEGLVNKVNIPNMTPETIMLVHELIDRYKIEPVSPEIPALPSSHESTTGSLDTLPQDAGLVYELWKNGKSQNEIATATKFPRTKVSNLISYLQGRGLIGDGKN